MIVMTSKRFTVLRYGDVCFRAATFDEVFGGIAAHHSKSQKAAGFCIALRVDFIDVGEKPPHYGGYAIVDHHEPLDAVEVR